VIRALKSVWGLVRRRRLRAAMLEADGVRPARGRADDADVRAFQALSRLVRAAATPTEPVPPFDRFWASVERIHDQRPAESERVSWWKQWIERRPVWVLAPLGALLIVVTLGILWFTRPPDTPSNQCFVDSYEVESGSVLIDQDPDSPETPTVIWYQEEG
jgi:hypothetical protein